MLLRVADYAVRQTFSNIGALDIYSGVRARLAEFGKRTWYAFSIVFSAGKFGILKNAVFAFAALSTMIQSASRLPFCVYWVLSSKTLTMIPYDVRAGPHDHRNFGGRERSELRLKKTGWQSRHHYAVRKVVSGAVKRSGDRLRRVTSVDVNNIDVQYGTNLVELFSDVGALEHTTLHVVDFLSSRLDLERLRDTD